MMGRLLTVKDSSDPMNNRCPEIHPANEVVVVRWLGFTIKNVEYGFVENRDRT